MRPSRPPGRGSARLPAVRPACGSGRSVSENILRQRTVLQTCAHVPAPSSPARASRCASSSISRLLTGVDVLQARAELLPSQCARAELLRARQTRADQGGHLRVERPLCGVRMRDSAVGGEGCCCADKGRSHVIMEDSVLFSSLPGRHGGVHSHRQPDQRPPVRDLQHARHTHEAHTDLSTRQHRGANAPWRAWVVGSPARRSHFGST